MHWSLAELREMDLDEYQELLIWASEKGKDPDSVDADAIVEARIAKDRQAREDVDSDE